MVKMTLDEFTAKIQQLIPGAVVSTNGDEYIIHTGLTINAEGYMVSSSKYEYEGGGAPVDLDDVVADNDIDLDSIMFTGNRDTGTYHGKRVVIHYIVSPKDHAVVIFDDTHRLSEVVPLSKVVVDRDSNE